MLVALIAGQAHPADPRLRPWSIQEVQHRVRDEAERQVGEEPTGMGLPRIVLLPGRQADRLIERLAWTRNKPTPRPRPYRVSCPLRVTGRCSRSAP